MEQTLRQRQYFKSKIFQRQRPEDFEALAMELFRFQARHNPVYREYLQQISCTPDRLHQLHDVPFLPISFFKSRQVLSGEAQVQEVFSSSGTTGSQRSRHYVKDLELYEQSFFLGFRHFYGPVEDYCVLALLPSYLNRKASSLVYMADHFIKLSRDKDSGFYLDDLASLYRLLKRKLQEKQKILLLGVSFALLDLAEKYKLPPGDLIVMETGGMKGRRREMLRSELHGILKPAFGVEKIHSEYGMTELLSQAYSQGQGRFFTPPWMRVRIRQTDDPFSAAKPGKTGGINVIDLANIDSCAFVETQDLGRLYADTSFEVMGRFDNADIRGCNLMVI